MRPPGIPSILCQIILGKNKNCFIQISVKLIFVSYCSVWVKELNAVIVRTVLISTRVVELDNRADK